jgi:antitoxin CptB
VSTDDDYRRKRLIYRSWHRGTREMDLIMGSFADQHIPSMTDAELVVYEEILNHNDPDLYNWIAGQEVLPANFLNPVMEKLLVYKFKKD